MPVATLKVATNNLMALPRNPKVDKTLRAAPGASMVFVQEGNLPGFKTAMAHLGSHRVPVPGFIGKGQAFSCVILFDPSVWRHISSDFPLAYDGHHKISLNRHLCVSEFEFLPLGQHFGGISYHSVTAGRDAQRNRMRREGDSAVKRAKDAFQARGLPVLLGTDQNGTSNRLGPASIHTKHRLDHIYGWDGTHVALGKRAKRIIDTRSDHDTLVAGLTVTTR